MAKRALGTVVFCLSFLAPALAEEEIRLAGSPALSPDGRTLVFVWRDDLWQASSDGGPAERLTYHASRERSPRFSRDGKSIAFTSDRSGTQQVYVMPAGGGDPRQITFHSEGSTVDDWFPDGRAVLIRGTRDHYWRRAQRLFLKRLDPKAAPVLLFNDYGSSPRVSPDGRFILFTREGTAWWRKQYTGSQASQVWLYDTAARSFRRLSQGDHEERSPLWHGDGKRVFYVSQEDGTYNLWERDLAGGAPLQLTHFRDDGVAFPTISADGKTIVFRRLFDLYKIDLAGARRPRKLALRWDGDRIHELKRRDMLTTATQVAFSDDGREIAFIAGGDLWVMDTELKEPLQVTRTPAEERDPVFAPDFGSIVYVSETGGRCDLWKVTRGDEKRFWWQQKEFREHRLTNDAQPEFRPRFTPDGRLAFTSLRGDLWTMNPDGTDTRVVVESWNEPSYDFSPDGKWVAYALSDADFNRDIWIRRTDGTGEPFNVSRHPDFESNPKWSPDGRVLAFTGRRAHTESDIYFVWLRKADDDQTRRDRTLEKALEKMKGREKKGSEERARPARSSSLWDWLRPARARQPARPRRERKKEEKLPEVEIDFDGIHDRIRRVSIPDTSESMLLWSPDSKKLAFRARIDGKSGLYSVSIPDELRPKAITTQAGSGGRWLADGNQIVWLQRGSPASLTASGRPTSYEFRARQEVDRIERNLCAFDLAWRTIGDRWYDERLNNRDWIAMRDKYRPMAEKCVTARELEEVMSLLLGELNGSHLGFRAREASGGRRPAGWRETTWHLGARFDASWKGPGLRIKDVVEGTPAAKEKSRLSPGEIVLSVDGKPLDPAVDIATVLTGRDTGDLQLRVKGKDGKERDVSLRPTSYGIVRRRLYEQWLDENQAKVAELSGGKLGYLHIRGMNWRSFERFETELYKVGHGKEGLIIDVRDNGGGSTTDHLLTCLCQPVHAITVARGGAAGYPQDRIVYARWSKPIVVLCNQNSFSNAEIFSHAIKTLRRGRIVGVPTAGGVISTGGTSIMGFAMLRLPFRGWFVGETGEDMERNGCVPHAIVWPQPEELPNGLDRQLRKGVEYLLEDVRAYKARPRPDLMRASQRNERSVTPVAGGG